MVMSGTTYPIRSPGQLNAGRRKFAVNLVSFPRLHFLIYGFAPFRSGGSQQCRALSVHTSTSQLFGNKKVMAVCNPRRHVHLTVSALL
jgi:tubulin beta